MKMEKNRNENFGEIKAGDIFWSASAPRGLTWGPLDDVVMGGKSSSEIKITDSLKWNADVTTENNGGFAGIRTKTFAAIDGSSCKGLKLNIDGTQGEDLKLILRDNGEWNGIAWAKTFSTNKMGSTSVAIPFNSLVPTKFARKVAGMGTFNSKNIQAVQITFSKFEYDGGLNPTFHEGKFQFQLNDIKFY